MQKWKERNRSWKEEKLMKLTWQIYHPQCKVRRTFTLSSSQIITEYFSMHLLQSYCKKLDIWQFDGIYYLMFLISQPIFPSNVKKNSLVVYKYFQLLNSNNSNVIERENLLIDQLWFLIKPSISEKFSNLSPFEKYYFYLGFIEMDEICILNGVKELINCSWGINLKAKHSSSQPILLLKIIYNSYMRK